MQKSTIEVVKQERRAAAERLAGLEALQTSMEQSGLTNVKVFDGQPDPNVSRKALDKVLDELALDETKERIKVQADKRKSTTLVSRVELLEEQIEPKASGKITDPSSTKRAEIAEKLRLTAENIEANADELPEDPRADSLVSLENGVVRVSEDVKARIEANKKQIADLKQLERLMEDAEKLKDDKKEGKEEKAEISNDLEIISYGDQKEELTKLDEDLDELGLKRDDIFTEKVDPNAKPKDKDEDPDKKVFKEYEINELTRAKLQIQKERHEQLAKDFGVEDPDDPEFLVKTAKSFGERQARLTVNFSESAFINQVRRLGLDPDDPDFLNRLPNAIKDLGPTDPREVRDMQRLLAAGFTRRNSILKLKAEHGELLDLHEEKGARDGVLGGINGILEGINETGERKNDAFGEQTMRVFKNREQKEKYFQNIARQISDLQVPLQAIVMRKYMTGLSAADAATLREYINKENRRAGPAALLGKGLKFASDKVDKGLAFVGNKTGVTAVYRKVNSRIAAAENAYLAWDKSSKQTAAIHIGRITNKYKKRMAERENKGFLGKMFTLGGAIISNMVEAAATSAMKVKTVASVVNGVRTNIQTLKQYAQAVKGSAPVRAVTRVYNAGKAIVGGVGALANGASRGFTPALGTAIAAAALGLPGPAILAVAATAGGVGAVTRSVEQMLSMPMKTLSKTPLFTFATSERLGQLGQNFGNFIKNNNYSMRLTEKTLERFQEVGRYTRAAQALRGFNRFLVAAPIGMALGTLVGGPAGALAGLAFAGGGSVAISVAGDRLSNLVFRGGASQLIPLLNKIPFTSALNMLQSQASLASMVRVWRDDLGLKDYDVTTGKRMRAGDFERSMYSFKTPAGAAMNLLQLGLFTQSAWTVNSALLNGGFGALRDLGIKAFGGGFSKLLNSLPFAARFADGLSRIGATNALLSSTRAGVWAVRGFALGGVLGGTLGSLAGFSIAASLGLSPGIAAFLGGSVGGIVGGVIGASLGATLGATLGGLIGTTILPGIGTVAGAAIGTKIGTILGSWFGSFLGSLSGTFLGSVLDTNFFNKILGMIPNVVSPITLLLGAKEFINFLSTPIRNLSDYATIAVMAFSAINFVVALEKASAGSVFTDEANTNSEARIVERKYPDFSFSAAGVEVSSDEQTLIANPSAEATLEINGVDSYQKLESGKIALRIGDQYWLIDNASNAQFIPTMSKFMAKGQGISIANFKYDTANAGNNDNGRVAGINNGGTAVDSETLVRGNFCEIFPGTAGCK